MIHVQTTFWLFGHRPSSNRPPVNRTIHNPGPLTLHKQHKHCRTRERDSEFCVRHWVALQRACHQALCLSSSRQILCFNFLLIILAISAFPLFERAYPLVWRCCHFLLNYFLPGFLTHWQTMLMISSFRIYILGAFSISPSGRDGFRVIQLCVWLNFRSPRSRSRESFQHERSKAINAEISNLSSRREIFTEPCWPKIHTKIYGRDWIFKKDSIQKKKFFILNFKFWSRSGEPKDTCHCERKLSVSD